MQLSCQACISVMAVATAPAMRCAADHCPSPAHVALSPQVWIEMCLTASLKPLGAVKPATDTWHSQCTHTHRGEGRAVALRAGCGLADRPGAIQKCI